MKPNSRKTARRPRTGKPAQTPPATAAAVETVDQGTASIQPQAVDHTEAPVEHVAQTPHAEQPASTVSDDAGDGGFDELFAGEPTQPEAPMAAAVPPQHNAADESVTDQDRGEQSADTGSSAQPDAVMFAGEQYPLRRIPIGLAQTVVGQERTNQAAAMNSAIVSDLRTRMRVTDGRCAPMIFIAPANPEEAPMLFAGTEILAAAMAAGDDGVCVVMLPPDVAQRVQGVLATSLNLLKDVPEHDFVWRGMGRVTARSDSPA